MERGDLFLSYKKLEFTLDNIIYNCETDGKENLEVVLPRKTPKASEYRSKFTKETVSVLVQPVVQIEIRLFVKVGTKGSPKLYIHGEDNKSVITYDGVPKALKPSSNNLLVMATVDGGNTWAIRCYNYGDTQENVVYGENHATSINGVLPNPVDGSIIIDSTKIHLNGEDSPTIAQQFDDISTQIVTLQETIVSDVKDEVVTILPDMIKTELDGIEIIAEKV